MVVVFNFQQSPNNPSHNYGISVKFYQRFSVQGSPWVVILLVTFYKCQSALYNFLKWYPTIFIVRFSVKLEPSFTPLLRKVVTSTVLFYSTLKTMEYFLIEKYIFSVEKCMAMLYRYTIACLYISKIGIFDNAYLT